MKPNGSGEWPYDPNEVFSSDELHEALRLRNRVLPASDQPRRDRCPHTPPCPTLQVCIEEISWYLCHQREIEAQL